MEKLKLNKEFRRAYGRGKAFVYPGFVIYIFKTNKGVPRLGITAGKKVGGAVWRNRAKRLIRAAFMQCLPNIKTGCDIVIVARSRIFTLKSYQIAAELEAQLKTLEMWREND